MPEAQVHAWLARQLCPQHFLHHGLWHLLAGLGESIVAVRGQAEGAVEVGDAAAGERLAERDALRPRHRQRGGRAQRLGDAPAAQVLHGAHARRLSPRAPVRDLGPWLKQDAGDPVQAQFGGRGQAGRAATDDDHRADAHDCILSASRRPREGNFID